MQALSQLSYSPKYNILPRLGYVTDMASPRGLEPATPGVTGRYSNQLNYHSWQEALLAII